MTAATPRRRPHVSCVLLALVVFVTACTSSDDDNGSPDSSSGAASPEASSPATGGGEDDVTLATVNGDPITRDELFRAIAAGRFASGLGGPIELSSVEAAQAMTNLIGVEMLRRPAAGIGVEFSEFLTGNPATEEQELLDLFKDIADALLGIGSDSEAAVAVDSELARMPAEDRPVCSRQIVVGTQDQADDVIGLLEGGRDFAELAAGVSSDESASFGGYLGCGPARGFIPVFADALSDLDVGELSSPVETEFGFHVIRRDPLEQGARDQLLDRMRNTILAPWIEDAFSAAVITLDPRIGVWDGGTVTPVVAE